jgi:hypothetical protein
MRYRLRAHHQALGTVELLFACGEELPVVPDVDRCDVQSVLTSVANVPI